MPYSTTNVFNVNIVIFVNIEAELTNSSHKPYHHGDLRRALIAAGIALLRSEGAAALDLRKVARSVGVSNAAPYRHFEDKRALLVAIAEEGFNELTDRLRSAVSEEDAQQPQLAVLLWAYVEFALSEPALMREMFSGLTIDRADYPSLHAASKQAFDMLLQLIEREQAAGLLVRDDPVKQSMVMWSMCHGLAMLLMENQMLMLEGSPAAIDDMIRRCAASLYEGLGPR